MTKASLYSRAQVSRIIGVKSPNLARDFPAFFAAGRQGPFGKLWTEQQIRALCEHVGVEFDPAKAAK